MSNRGVDEGPMPEQGDTGLSWFDRLASKVNDFTSNAWFFSLCLLLVVLWGPSYFLFGTVDTWQLVINTVTTIVTFLLVALLQNTQKRSDDALHHKLNAMAEGLAHLMEEVGDQRPALREDTEQLRAAVGLETRESA